MNELFRLEDILRHVYSGRADVSMIDELIAWLQVRREAVQQKELKEDNQEFNGEGVS